MPSCACRIDAATMVCERLLASDGIKLAGACTAWLLKPWNSW